MKLWNLVLLIIVQITSISAYYSEGWTPGAASTASPIPAAPTSTSGFGGFSFDWTSLVRSGPIANLLSKAGVNVTQHLEEATMRAGKKPWDTRVPMITDNNYDQLVVNEALTTQEEKDRTWFIVVSLGAGNDPISTYVDQQFDGAYNLSITNHDLPHIRFGRIDYLTETQVTSRWMVWKAPVLVIVKERGRVLRFIYPKEINLDPQNLHKFLKLEAWNEVPPWDGPFAPGGDLEEWVAWYADWSTKLYGVVSRIPKWVFLVASGSIGSFIISLMHSRGKNETNAKPAKISRYVVKPAAKVQLPTEEPKPATPTATTTKKRKGSKK